MANKSYEDLDEGAPDYHAYPVNRNQAFYVRAMLRRGLITTLADVANIRRTLDEYGSEVPGFMRLSLENAADHSQQLMAEAVDVFKDLPEEIRPVLNDYTDIKPFGPLPEKHALTDRWTTLEDVDAEIARLQIARARLVAQATLGDDDSGIDATP